ncbi:hypothetical protein GT347_22700 [Xylophilus rhododendri]|uniref:Uncharacterized protein n=1 Tax=Xylophilus rhododendri TaxID=2697032 RepID=A0A857J9G5_9BURK|nr:hypothetical protein [Xylophilus rhododendri]QHJ00537.1 hypothetical protein GT347_22700 [Xylophilus rhododendri]
MNIRRQIRFSSVFLMFASTLIQPAAAQLPPIDVYGVSIGPAGASLGAAGGVSFGVGEPFQGFVVLTALAEKYEMARDVRCLAAGTDLRNTTSRSSSLDRWMAAERVYRVLLTYTTALDIIGLGKTPLKRDKKFTVIYADGGEETYVVTSPLSSAALSGYGTDLKQKDGVVHRHVVCG